MLMSAVGSSHKGFTLLELLVVISIIAIASAGITFTLRDSSEAMLEKEAIRLVALLESARAQSRLTGTPVIWHPTQEGFVFEGVPPSAMPERWLHHNVLVQADTASNSAGSAVALLLGPEPMIGPQSILVGEEGTPVPFSTRYRIFSNGLSPFDLEQVRRP